jgi:hypothetical protein
MKFITLCIFLIITLSSMVNVFSRHRNTHKRRNHRVKSHDPQKFVNSVEFLLGGIGALTRNIYTIEKVPKYIPESCHNVYEKEKNGELMKLKEA